MVAPIIIIWALIWISICLNYIKPLSQLSFWDQLLVFIILAIAAPALFLAEIVDALLDLIMPPGWMTMVILPCKSREIKRRKFKKC